MLIGVAFGIVDADSQLESGPVLYVLIIDY